MGGKGDGDRGSQRRTSTQVLGPLRDEKDKKGCMEASSEFKQRVVTAVAVAFLHA